VATCCTGFPVTGKSPKENSLGEITRQLHHEEDADK